MKPVSNRWWKDQCNAIQPRKSPGSPAAACNGLLLLLLLLQEAVEEAADCMVIEAVKKAVAEQAVREVVASKPSTR